MNIVRSPTARPGGSGSFSGRLRSARSTWPQSSPSTSLGAVVMPHRSPRNNHHRCTLHAPTAPSCPPSPTKSPTLAPHGPRYPYKTPMALAHHGPQHHTRSHTLTTHSPAHGWKPGWNSWKLVGNQETGTTHRGEIVPLWDN